MTTTWKPVAWDYQVGQTKLSIEANEGEVPPSARDGFTVELWWSPERGQYFAYRKSEVLGFPPEAEHDGVNLTPPGSTEPVYIDTGLASFIQHLWNLGVRTTACCQGDACGGDPQTGGMPGRWGYISVPNEDTAKAEPIIEAFGFTHLVKDDRERDGKFTVWRFKGLS